MQIFWLRYTKKRTSDNLKLWMRLSLFDAYTLCLGYNLLPDKTGLSDTKKCTCQKYFRLKWISAFLLNLKVLQIPCILVPALSLYPQSPLSSEPMMVTHQQPGSGLLNFKWPFWFPWHHMGLWWAYFFMISLDIKLFKKEYWLYH